MADQPGADTAYAHKHATPSSPPVTSVALTDGSRVTLRPLGTEHVRIESGFWAERQRRNREVTIPAGYEQLERAGNFDNLRIVAGRASGSYRGLLFNDSDIYKWLEAVGWELARERSAERSRGRRYDDPVHHHLSAPTALLREGNDRRRGQIATRDVIRTPDSAVTR